MVRLKKILVSVLVLSPYLISKMPCTVPLKREAGRDRRKDVATTAGLMDDTRLQLTGAVSIIFLCFMFHPLLTSRRLSDSFGQGFPLGA